MSLDGLTLFRGMNGKMNWLSQRQIVTSTNIANADTPDYRPRDIEGFSFKDAVKTNRNKLFTPTGSALKGGIAQSASNHITDSKLKEFADVDAKRQRKTYQVAPSGNAVVIEEQMMRASKTAMEYQAVSNLYKKHFSMLMTSIGRGGEG